MTDIVAVHGIFMNRRSRQQMRDDWRSAIVRGLQNVRAGGADEVEVECAYYGHLYNDGKAGLDAAYRPADLDTGLERELFLAIADATADEEVERPEPAAPTKLWVPERVQGAVRRIERHGIFDGASGVVIRLVKQVGRYLGDADFRERVLAELTEAMRVKPRVLVAHSLGSVVAYDWLCRQSTPTVSTLVTIGSPLGFRGIRKALHPDLGATLPPWPGVHTWVNVAAREDAVATVKTLDGLFVGPITDRLASNSRRTAHSATVYLQNVHTSTAMKTALRERG
ncbi:lipase family protein [Micromonospora fluostatini]|uniref:hypothetical protein n=1 Tax=Micromonospora sp. JCM 30529 TaxID=3421643 RepID=UPI003D176DE2